MDTDKTYREKLNGNYSRMLRAIMNNFWKQDPAKQQLYGYWLSISKTIQVRQTRHAVYNWRLEKQGWTHKRPSSTDPSYGRPILTWPTRTHLQQLCTDTGCSLKDLPRAINDRDWWKDSQGNLYLHHNLMVYIYIYIYIYIYELSCFAWCMTSQLFG